MNQLSSQEYKKLSAVASCLAIDQVEAANSGHPGAPLGMSDFLTVLFAKFLKFYAPNPNWHNRDRFILSNGHASAMLYSLLYLCNYNGGPTLQEIKTFRKLGSPCAGHPEFRHLAGVETSTGPLGQGFANAVGFAIAEKKYEAEFGKDLIDHKIYVTVGDGCLMEGISHEAASLAGHLKLNNLIAMFDSNGITIDGSVSLADSTNTKIRFESYGWRVLQANGHNFDEIEQAFTLANDDSCNKPVLIIFDTIIGYGSDKKAGTAASHGAPLGLTEYSFTKANLGLGDYAAFEYPEEILSQWMDIGLRSHDEYESWNAHLNKDKAEKSKLIQWFDKDFGGEIESVFSKLKHEYAFLAKDESTRKSGGTILQALLQKIPNIIGGSADLSESNLVLGSASTIYSSTYYNGNYIHFGIREHAAAASLNGLACYGGLFPFTSGFLIFSDYAKASIRLSALMAVQALYIFTHDSIGLGEDGPTHQPVEQLAGLRSIVGVHVFRPADMIEAIAAYESAFMYKNGPTIMALSRQNLKQLGARDTSNIHKGAYVLSDYNHSNEHAKKIIIIATGSEVSIALDVKNILIHSALDVRVVSMLSTNVFDLQSKEYKDSVLGGSAQDCLPLMVAIEAASEYGWHKYIGRDGLFFGINSFGLSAPAPDLYKHFGLTAESISSRILSCMN